MKSSGVRLAGKRECSSDLEPPASQTPEVLIESQTQRLPARMEESSRDAPSAPPSCHPCREAACSPSASCSPRRQSGSGSSPSPPSPLPFSPPCIDWRRRRRTGSARAGMILALSTLLLLLKGGRAVERRGGAAFIFRPSSSRFASSSLRSTKTDAALPTSSVTVLPDLPDHNAPVPPTLIDAEDDKANHHESEPGEKCPFEHTDHAAAATAPAAPLESASACPHSEMAAAQTETRGSTPAACPHAGDMRIVSSYKDETIEKGREWLFSMFPRGKPGEPVTVGDQLAVIVKNIDQVYDHQPSYDGAPVAEGRITDPDAIFLDLYDNYKESGGVFKLLFGPKSFIVVSDPIIMKHLLKGASHKYDKGVLAEILEPIMGKGLIPADPATWKVRRRVLAPAFHQMWLDHMVGVYNDCNHLLVQELHKAVDKGKVVDMESAFNSVSLDIIGKSVFNYEFRSVTEESPVIKAVYSLLQEAEHRSTIPLPYWKLPFANQLVPRLRRFNRDLKVVNEVLDELIEQAKAQAGGREEDLESLLNRDYASCSDASLLRFLVDLRGEDIDKSNKQLRDDLATLLIAGHETTASVLTWALYELSLPENNEILQKVLKEVDAVLGDETPTWELINKMPLLRLCLAESLRKYPEPPFLIRRALEDDTFPKGTAGFNCRMMRGQDVFLAIYNIHHSPLFWEDPHKFDPERFLRPHSNPDVPAWRGYQPPESGFYYEEGQFGPLYPTETMADFAFLPFGGGTRKCVGDQFAFLEASVTLSLLLRRFSFELAVPAHEVGMKTGATIHTKNGLIMKVARRNTGAPPQPSMNKAQAPPISRQIPRRSTDESMRTAMKAAPAGMSPSAFHAAAAAGEGDEKRQHESQLSQMMRLFSR
ncbi:unnamed protein product [Vitrella brassicaformis CCMP3155]|uniref:Cytochrome P450 n=1 Tax=Vitrella brassicaformis (strain CCMP3155) TaxID=1169540 RepID=A0A0G4FDM1_VITBC|nr:unnamed protein product [Vitrella brassicaformis CCMP3155]|eukprot:CEM10973.1 unnamed protein product [Vitrella brassicaformis CCMP3155]